jgi:hypothetical protein
MLQHTFMHIQSTGAVTEQRLWQAGLSDWGAFSDDISIALSGKRKYLSNYLIPRLLNFFHPDNFKLPAA